MQFIIISFSHFPPYELTKLDKRKWVKENKERRRNKERISGIKGEPGKGQTAEDDAENMRKN